MTSKQLYEEIGKNECIEYGDFPLNNIYKFEFNFNITNLLSNLDNISLVSKVYNETIQEQESILNFEFNKLVALNSKALLLLLHKWAHKIIVSTLL